MYLFTIYTFHFTPFTLTFLIILWHSNKNEQALSSSDWRAVKLAWLGQWVEREQHCTLNFCSWTPLTRGSERFIRKTKLLLLNKNEIARNFNMHSYGNYSKIMYLQQCASPFQYYPEVFVHIWSEYSEMTKMHLTCKMSHLVVPGEFKSPMYVFQLTVKVYDKATLLPILSPKTPCFSHSPTI